MSRSGPDYITPAISPEVRSRVSSPERTATIGSVSPATSVREGTPPVNSEPGNPDTNSMVATDVRLPTFNGNGMEHLEQHWFLYEAVWMVCLVHNADIKKAQMIANLRGHTLDWFMKLCATPIETL